MDALTTKTIAAQLALVDFVSDRLEQLRSSDRGQASTEYAGILFVIVAIIAIIVAAGSDIGDAIKGRITDAVSKVGK
jgi:Flp pilus assembly pilin Flp